MNIISNNLIYLREHIAEYEKKYHRIPHSVSLLAVSKGQSIEKIAAAHTAGQNAFGENYLQEALPKIAAFSNENIEWHFIGPIQSNKTKKIAAHFHWVHSVANLRIAERLNNQRPNELPPLNICLEVNVSQEASKSGANFENTFALADQCARLPRLKLHGLMTIPSPSSDFTEQRNEFHKLTILYEKLREKGFLLDTLSMGMSNDWEAAIAEGATIIRIGTALFGSR